MTSTPVAGAQEPQKQTHTALAALTKDFLSTAKCSYPEASTCAVDMLRSCARLDAAGIDAISASIAALAHARQAAVSLSTAAGDWNLMFQAVKERLRLAVGKVLIASPGLEPQTAGVLTQTIVLECVGALDQLHATLTNERGLRERLELEIVGAQAALAGALAGASPASREVVPLLHSVLQRLNPDPAPSTV